MSDIRIGDELEATDALGRKFVKRALSEAERGGAYPAAWVCATEVWTASRARGETPEAEPFPWPIDSLRVISARNPGGRTNDAAG